MVYDVPAQAAVVSFRRDADERARFGVRSIAQ